MNTVIINEQQLQTEVDALKKQFSDTKDIYREVCVLLFFRYGITPTANKLYQYVRRGSMSAPAEALNKFWLELREKSRVRVERPDIPDNIASVAGDFIANLWNEAQKAAQAGFSELIENANAEILKFKLDAQLARQNAEEIQAKLDESNLELEKSKQLNSETDYLLQVNTTTLTHQEKSLREHKIERDNFQQLLIDAKSSFSKDLIAVNLSLFKAEERYVALEKKSLLEIDRARQQIKSLEKEIHVLRQIGKKEQSSYINELDKKMHIIAALNNKVGTLHGKLIEVTKQNKKITAKLALNEKKSIAMKS
ncbi:DNA-binding protein [Methylotenera sp.]|uniref:DNA-binding protein n=1 Tax=Methylotenera sp. TaxID=2051956 RepID=UPI002732FFA6|nr:DNA-binding protein [Methylotenera sp.]MDP3211603.1 DNA-binding protein [Methylotenera sp.]